MNYGREKHVNQTLNKIVANENRIKMCVNIKMCSAI